MDTTKFWDSFYQAHSMPREWYCEDECFSTLVGQLATWHRALFPVVMRDKHGESSHIYRVLHVGCGTSMLGEYLLNEKYVDYVENIDFSSKCIDTMKEYVGKERSPSYLQMDICTLSYSDCVWNCLLDKGTLDAISCGIRHRGSMNKFTHHVNTQQESNVSDAKTSHLVESTISDAKTSNLVESTVSDAKTSHLEEPLNILSGIVRVLKQNGYGMGLIFSILAPEKHLFAQLLDTTHVCNIFTFTTKSCTETPIQVLQRSLFQNGSKIKVTTDLIDELVDQIIEYAPVCINNTEILISLARLKIPPLEEPSLDHMWLYLFVQR